MDLCRVFLQAAAGLALVSAACHRFSPPANPATAAARPPNFLVILADDLGWKDLSIEGSGFYETPNLDRLAAQGLRFAAGYAAGAVCSPSRSALLTGRYPARTGVTDWIRPAFLRKAAKPGVDPTRPPAASAPEEKLLVPSTPVRLERDEVTIAEALQSSGYVSGHVGKWHLGDDGWYPTQQGFAHNAGGCDLGQPPTYFDPYRNRQVPGGIPTLAARRPGEYLTDREADEVVAFLRQHGNRPFFLYYAPYAVHRPLEAKPELVAKYKRKAKTDHSHAVYAAMIESLDEAVGKILAALDALGLARDTLVVFTSDNGGLDRDGVPTDNAPLRAGKAHPYEGGIRVPFFARWPGVIRPGSISREPVSGIDVLPTLLDLAGAAAPRGRTIDGLSLAAHLRASGATALDRQALYWHYPHYRRPDVAPYSVVRAGTWKLIKRYEGPRHELYDLAADPYEQDDLASRMPERVRTLAKALDRHLETAGAKLPAPNPAAQAAAP